MRKGYIALVLTEEGRERLLSRITPAHPDVITHHVTWEFKVSEDAPLPEVSQVMVVAVACNDKIQAATVEVNGTSRKPDNRIAHVTISLDSAKGAKPVHSNDLLSEGLSDELDVFDIPVEPRFIPFG